MSPEAMRSVTTSAFMLSAIARPAASAASTSDVEPVNFAHAPYRSLISTWSTRIVPAFSAASSAAMVAVQLFTSSRPSAVME